MNIHKKLTVGALAVAALVANPTAAGADPTPTPITNAPAVPAATADVECGKITITFNNPTRHLFVFDYKVDNEWPKHGPVAQGTIKEGPLAGKPWPKRYNLVTVDGRAGQDERKVTLRFKTGTHKVAWRLAEGAEQKWFFDWQSATVKTRCKPGKDHRPGQGHHKPGKNHHHKSHKKQVKRTVAPAKPSVKQPRCSVRKGFITIPKVEGVVYTRNGRVQRPGYVWAAPGKHVVRAQAAKGYTLKRHSSTSWTLKVDKAPSDYTCS